MAETVTRSAPPRSTEFAPRSYVHFLESPGCHEPGHECIGQAIGESLGIARPLTDEFSLPLSFSVGARHRRVGRMIEMAEPARHEALERLGIFIGEWALEACFPGDAPAAAQGPPGLQQAGGETGTGARSVFEWALDGRLLMQRTEVRLPGAPDSLAIVSCDPRTGAYTQHYFDSRGVTRLYAMSLADSDWELLRDSPDFSPLDFSQRFTARFSDDGDTIRGT